MCNSVKSKPAEKTDGLADCNTRAWIDLSAWAVCTAVEMAWNLRFCELTKEKKVAWMRHTKTVDDTKEPTPSIMTYISKDNELTGGRFMVTVATPVDPSRDVRTTSSLGVVVVEKHSAATRRVPDKECLAP